MFCRKQPNKPHRVSVVTDNVSRNVNNSGIKRQNATRFHPIPLGVSSRIKQGQYYHELYRSERENRRKDLIEVDM